MTPSELIIELDDYIKVAEQHDAKEGFPYANVRIDVLRELKEVVARVEGLLK